jgi:predicted enzyme related to lactoylglutathione lyase
MPERRLRRCLLLLWEFRAGCASLPPMKVEGLKYIIWAKDMARAARFYRGVFDGECVRENEVVTEFRIAGSTVGIHCGGESERTWTGMAFQVADLFEGCALVKAHGGQVLREPVDTPEEPAHLAMCVDSEGNEIMLTKARHR